MKFDRDQIAEAGLFYCVPWMRQAEARIAALEAALEELLHACAGVDVFHWSVPTLDSQANPQGDSK
jgi:hypothetical protein